MWLPVEETNDQTPSWLPLIYSVALAIATGLAAAAIFISIARH